MGFRGDLRDIDLANIFQTLGMNQHEGILRVSDSQRMAEIYFDKRGIRLLVNDRKPYTLLGELLLRRQLVKEVDLHRALKIQNATGKRMGEILVEEGYLKAEELAKVLREQMEEKIYEIFSWNEAKFQFDAGVPPPDDPFFSEDRGQADYLTFNINSIMMEAARRIDEWGLINEVIPGRSEVPILLRPVKEVLAGDYETSPSTVADVVGLINGHRTVERIIKDGGHGNFKTCKIIKLLVDKGNAGFIPTEELIRLANSYLTAQRTDDGVEAYRTATARHPDDIDLRLRFAEAALDQGLTKVAGEVYREIAYINEDHGDPRKALASYTTAVELNEADEASHERLYALYRELNEKELAREEGRILAKIKADNNRFNEAEAILVELKDDYILDVAVIKQLIKIYLERKEKGKAIAELEALGHTCEIKRRFPEAEEAYQMILRLDKSRQDIQEKLDQISTQAIKSKSRPRMGKLLLVIIIVALVGSGGLFIFKKIDFARRADNELNRIREAFLALEAIPEVDDPAAYEKLKDETADLEERLGAFRDEFGPREGVVSLQSEVRGRLARLDTYVSNLRDRRRRDSERLLRSAEQKRREGKLEDALNLAGQVIASEDTYPSVLADARQLMGEIEEYRAAAAGLARQAREAEGAEEWARAYERWSELREKYEHAEVARSVLYPLKLRTEPEGAEVYLDGEFQGKTPWVIRYDPVRGGRIELRRTGFGKTEFDISGGGVRDVPLVKAVAQVFNEDGGDWEGAVKTDLVGAEGGAFAATLKGEILRISQPEGAGDWAVSWTLPTNKFNQIQARPVYHRGLLIVGLALQKGGQVTAVDAKGGREKWTVTFDRGQKIVLPLVLSEDGAAILVVAGNELHALDTADGARRWSHPLSSIEHPPVIAGEVVLLPIPDTNEVRRLVLESGEALLPNLRLPGVPAGPLCLGGDSGEALVFPDVSGKIHWVAAESGQPLFGGDPYDLGEADRVSDVQVFGDKVWVSPKGGSVMAMLLSIPDGTRVWAKSRQKDKQYGDLGPVTLSGSTFYLGTSNGYGLAVDAKSGEILWDLALSGSEERVGPAVKGAPCVAKDRLFFGGMDGRVYATVP